MFELAINGIVYQFKFGIGFVREINKKGAKVPVKDAPGVTEDMGLILLVTKILDGDVIALIDALEVANKGFDPRITRKILENHIDNEDTDIDELFETVKDFLEKTNATRNTMKKMMEALEAETSEE